MTNVQRNFLCNERRALDPRYACAELLWYLSRSDDTTMLQYYAPSYKNYTEDGKHAYGAYGYRIHNNVERGHGDSVGEGMDQLWRAVHLLKTKPDTRQCVISLWKPEDLFIENRKDMPCTLTWQFLLRDEKLHMVVNMRSNDAWLGFPYDVFTFSSIQMLVAASIGAYLGDYVHSVGSMHLYEKNLYPAMQAMNPMSQRETLAHGWHCVESLNDAPHYVELEKAVREHDALAFPPVLTEGGPLSDSVRACAQKRYHHEYEPLSPALRKGLDNIHNKENRE